jgi:hypothetical protein
MSLLSGEDDPGRLDKHGLDDDEAHLDDTVLGAEDTCKPGDPDPTVYDDRKEVCSSRHNGWWCTRTDGHEGQHVAGAGHMVAAVWP